MTDYGTSGLPATGEHVGGAVKGVGKGAGSAVATIGIAGSISNLMKEMPKMIKGKRLKSKKRKRKIKHKKLGF